MGTSHNLRRVFFFLYYVSSARKWTNCAIVPMRPMRPSRLNEDFIDAIRPRRNEAGGIFQECLS